MGNGYAAQLLSYANLLLRSSSSSFYLSQNNPKSIDWFRYLKGSSVIFSFVFKLLSFTPHFDMIYIRQSMIFLNASSLKLSSSFIKYFQKMPKIYSGSDFSKHFTTLIFTSLKQEDKCLRSHSINLVILECAPDFKY